MSQAMELVSKLKEIGDVRDMGPGQVALLDLEHRLQQERRRATRG
jgi:hypothetical protein